MTKKLKNDIALQVSSIGMTVSMFVVAVTFFLEVMECLSSLFVPSFFFFFVFIFNVTTSHQFQELKHPWHGIVYG